MRDRMPNHDRDWERFKVIDQLGAGAFGRTLLVLDSAKNDRQVVIKVPHDKRTEEALINDLINASALTANLTSFSHPNIVRCLGFARFEGFYVMILEYVKGRDLRKIIGPLHIVRKPMDMKMALRTFKDVCTGLCSAHSINLVHRDIKPDNIIIRDEDGIAKILDFGLSTIVQSTSVGSGSVAGTFPYMAPEALAGKASFHSDIWSLAVTFYEMLTGRLPFWDENLFSLKIRIDTADPVPPSRHNPAIEPRIEALILKGLAKSPAKRFHNAQEMLDAFEPAAIHKPTAAEDTVGTPEKARETRPQQKATAAPGPADHETAIAALRKQFLEGGDQAAVTRACELLDEDPRDPRLYMLVGELHNRQQQYSKAEAVVRRGIQVSPDHPGLHFYLAPALWNQGGIKRQEAITVLQRAIDLGLTPAQDKQARNLLRSWRATGGPS